MVSLLILTRNEEHDLPGCLESIRWSDDVHVFDSHSTDRTAAIAQAAGARVARRVFDNYADHRNAALRSLPFKHPWVLSLDADERVPRALAQELAEYARNAPAEVGAGRLRRRDFLWGTWLKHAQISPFYVRLFRVGRVHYEREINEVVVVDGEVHNFEEPFDHHPFSKGISHWLDKHNRYSTMEAALVAQEAACGDFKLSQAVFGKDFNERRRHQKALFYRMPFRPLTKFLYMMLWRRAFLDGRAGITYAALQSIYEYFIVLKTRELRRAADGRQRTEDGRRMTRAS